VEQTLFIATNTLDKAPASTAAMEVQENFFRTKALNFKIQKREDGALPVPSLLDVSAYSPFFKEDEVTPVTEIGHIAGILAWLDQGITINNAAVIKSDYGFLSGTLKG
jgi:hypothetical protein